MAADQLSLRVRSFTTTGLPVRPSISATLATRCITDTAVVGSHAARVETGALEMLVGAGEEVLRLAPTTTRIASTECLEAKALASPSTALQSGLRCSYRR